MRRLVSIIGSAVFLVIAPGTVAVLVPRWISGWRLSPPLLAFVGFRIIGVAEKVTQSRCTVETRPHPGNGTTCEAGGRCWAWTPSTGSIKELRMFTIDTA